MTIGVISQDEWLKLCSRKLEPKTNRPAARTFDSPQRRTSGRMATICMKTAVTAMNRKMVPTFCGCQL